MVANIGLTIQPPTIQNQLALDPSFNIGRSLLASDPLRGVQARTTGQGLAVFGGNFLKNFLGQTLMGQARDRAQQQVADFQSKLASIGAPIVGQPEAEVTFSEEGDIVEAPEVRTPTAEERLARLQALATEDPRFAGAAFQFGTQVAAAQQKQRAAAAKAAAEESRFVRGEFGKGQRVRFQQQQQNARLFVRAQLDDLKDQARQARQFGNEEALARIKGQERRITDAAKRGMVIDQAGNFRGFMPSFFTAQQMQSLARASGTPIVTGPGAVATIPAQLFPMFGAQPQAPTSPVPPGGQPLEVGTAPGVGAPAQSVAPVGMPQQQTRVDPITGRVTGTGRVAPSTATSINLFENPNPPPGSPERGMTRILTDEVKQIRSEGQEASRQLGQLGTLRNLLSGARTGLGTNITRRLKNFAQSSLGLDLGDINDTARLEAATTIIAEGLLRRRNPASGLGLPGNISNKELEFLQGSFVNLENLPGANEMILEVNIRAAQRKKRLARELSRRVAKEGRITTEAVDSYFDGLEEDLLTKEDINRIEEITQQSQGGNIPASQASDQELRRRLGVR